MALGHSTTIMMPFRVFSNRPVLNYILLNANIVEDSSPRARVHCFVLYESGLRTIQWNGAAFEPQLMPRQHRDRKPKHRLFWKLIVALAVTCSLLVALLQFRALGLASLSEFKHSSSSSSKAALPQFGFPYPQLAKLRAGLSAVYNAQQLSWQELTTAYAAVLHTLQRHGSTSAFTGSSSSSLQAFLQEARALLAAEPGILQCTEDPTLLSAWQMDAAPTETAATVTPKPLRARRYLLAANFHNSAAVLPNFIVQALHLAVLLPQGNLAVSCYESGSSDTSRLWLTLLHQLLLPLGVPHNITVGGALPGRLKLGRIQHLAALRNALLEPWLTQQHQQQHGRQLHARNKQQWIHPWVQALPLHGRAAGPARAAAGSGSLSHGSGSFVPDTLVFANDVLLCAGDVVRLVMHDAHIACGMDFYTAPWQQQQQGGNGAGDSKQEQDGDSVGQYSHDISPPQAVGDSSRAGLASYSSNSADDDDDFFDPVSQQLQQGPGAGKAEGKLGPAPLRFYDKVKAGGGGWCILSAGLQESIP